MNALLRATVFVVALGAVFAAAFGLGKAFDGGEPAADAATGHGHAEEYHLRVIDAPTDPGRAVLRFVVEDHDGEPVTRYDVRHEKRLHLVAVDTGYTGYQHLHPTMAADGTWSTPIALAPGYTQVYADFRPAGAEEAVARADLRVSGPIASPVLDRSRTQEVDGYAVTVVGDLEAGGTSGLRFEISKDGRPVTDLEPYLGAYGHLVMLRKADGEYLHVHPEEGQPGPEVAFAATVPSTARYHLYLDFKHGGTVRTAAFVLDASAAAEGGDGGGSDEHEEGHEEGHGGSGHGDH